MSYFFDSFVDGEAGQVNNINHISPERSRGFNLSIMYQLKINLLIATYVSLVS